MKTRWITLTAVALAVFAATGFAYLKLNSSGGPMTAAAETFVKSLSSDQAAKAVLAYSAPQRTDWHYIPKPERKGLQVKEMNDSQRKAAHALLRSSLSAVGYGKATRIMQLESILRELEKSRGGGPVRDPERYYFTVFGQPASSARWGLSVEGHHLSLNFVVDGDKVHLFDADLLRRQPGHADGRLWRRLQEGGPRAGQGRRAGLRAGRIAHARTAQRGDRRRQGAQGHSRRRPGVPAEFEPPRACRPAR